MKQPELGKRLKEARIAKKMTQSEVVGTFITRNMLSQIESGKAMPSVETLQYLAEVLGIPLQSLISSHQNTFAAIPEDPVDLLHRTKSALLNQDYSTVLTMTAAFPSMLEDEAFALSALAACGLAEQLLDQNGPEDSIEKAASLASEAMDRSSKGLYANEMIHSRALLLYNRAAHLLSQVHE